jgi:hypothetical protein
MKQQPVGEWKQVGDVHNGFKAVGEVSLNPRDYKTGASVKQTVIAAAESYENSAGWAIKSIGSERMEFWILEKADGKAE